MRWTTVVALVALASAAVWAGEGKERAFKFGKDDLGKVPAGWKAEQTGKGEGSVWKVVAGKRTQLGGKEGLKVPTGEWHKLKVEVKGNKMEGYLDGQKLWEVTDDTFKEAGKVGLWTKADAQSHFDQFTVSGK